MMEWIIIFYKAFWCSLAAVGFGILFNVPRKNLVVVWVGGLIVGLVKFSVLQYVSSSIILASFLAALIMSIYSMFIAYARLEPQMLLAIPCVIPLVPGAFAYRTMLGLMKLSGNVGPDYSRTLSETVHFGVLTVFIIMAFTLGIIIPYQAGKNILRKHRLNSGHTKPY